MKEEACWRRAQDFYKYFTEGARAYTEDRSRFDACPYGWPDGVAPGDVVFNAKPHRLLDLESMEQAGWLLGYWYANWFLEEPAMDLYAELYGAGCVMSLVWCTLHPAGPSTHKVEGPQATHHSNIVPLPGMNSNRGRYG